MSLVHDVFSGLTLLAVLSAGTAEGRASTGEKAADPASVAGQVTPVAADAEPRRFPRAGPFLAVLPADRAGGAPASDAMGNAGDHWDGGDPTQAGAYRGRIRGEMGFSRRERTAGVAVALIRRGDPTHLVLTSTGSDGFYQARGILEGEYRIVAYRDGVAPQTKDGVAVRGPFRSVVDVTLTPGDGAIPSVDLAAERNGGDGSAPSTGNVFFKVVDEQDAPRAGARVILRRLGGGVDPFVGETGAGGSVSLPQRPAGRYSLRVESPGHISVNVEPLLLAGTPLVVQVFLTPRPGDYPGSVLDLLPEERPVAPAGSVAAPRSVPDGPADGA